jgi:hypothetical protein
MQLLALTGVRTDCALIGVSLALQADIIEGLDSLQSRLKPTECETCATPVTYRQVIFYFEDRAWKIPVPFCPICSGNCPPITPN